MKKSNSILKMFTTIGAFIGAWFFSLLSTATPVLASTEVAQTAEHASLDNFVLLLALAAILVAAKFFHLIERIKQPPVVGELVAGIILGNLALLGIQFFTPIKTNEIIHFLAEIGVVLLLFQIGLESNIQELTKVGVQSVLVAIIGAVAPFALGAFVIGPVFLPEYGFITHLFIGATFSATSVGIPSRIFRDMGMMKTKAAKIFLGATVIDDIIGLVSLAVVSSLVTSGSLSVNTIGFIVAKSVLFLVASIAIGQLIAPWVSKAFAAIHHGVGSKFTLAISFCLTFAALAEMIGMEPIIGAFAAGLVLDPVHFKNFQEPEIVEAVKAKIAEVKPDLKEKVMRVLYRHSEKSVEDIIEPLALFFVPLFFVVTGMSVDVSTLFNPHIILVSLIISVVAVIGKVVAGLAVKGKDRWIVGMAMVSRGEVGLIFAAVGQQLGVLSAEAFSMVIITILVTTIVGPAFLTQLLRRAKS